ncbi:glycoside hydrolase [Panus rudis PR-1116 ss-1]|nr:glycoside hydrolase [Panus rudis PR-1116 ss-1]
MPLMGSCATLTGTMKQTMNGIGASGGWWPKDISLFPDSVRQNISQLLFNQNTGLGITDYRYNLGGGGVGVTTWARAPETPYISDGNYNWGADAAGTYFLRAAAQFGVPQITLFVNSAPTTFTSNGRNCGGTLITSRISAYATYLTDVVKYWKSQGVTITHVSPMNEPDNSFGSGSNCGQEGMIVQPSQRAQVVTAVATALRNAGLSTKVIADESSTVSQFNSEASQWLTSSIGASLGGVAHHQYGFASTNDQSSLGSTVQSRTGGNVAPWFTEICCFKEADSSQASNPLATLTYGQQFDPTMVSGLRMASLIDQSLSYSEDAHWDWWVALSSGIGCTPKTTSGCATNVNNQGWNDGLIYYDTNYQSTHDYTLYLTKRYTVLRHYAKAAPIGAVRRLVSNVEGNWRIQAFDLNGRLYSVVAFLGQQSSGSLTLSTDGSFTLTQPSRAFRSSPSEDYVQVSAPSLSGGKLTVNAPAMSIYTFFFQ